VAPPNTEIAAPDGASGYVACESANGLGEMPREKRPDALLRVSKIPLLGQPIGMATRHVGQAEDVMEHDDAGPESLALRRGQVALELVVRRRDRDLGHVSSQTI